MTKRSVFSMVFPILLGACASQSRAPAASTPSPPRLPAPSPANAPAALAQFELPPPEASQTKSLTLWATFYSVPRVRPDANGQPLKDKKGDAISPKLALRNWCDAAMEGTIQVETASDRWTTFNFSATAAAEQVDCTQWYPKHPAIGRSRFRATFHPFGEGSRGGPLIPFRTIAVDPDHIPYDTVLYIPEARGLTIKMPSGESRKHDGYFFASDTGGALHGNHIDVFLGPRGDNPFTFIGSKSEHTFEAQVVKSTELEDAFQQLHRAQDRS